MLFGARIFTIITTKMWWMGVQLVNFLLLAPGNPGLCNFFFAISYLGCKGTKRNHSRNNIEGKVEVVAYYIFQLSFLLIKWLAMKGCLYQWERGNLGENSSTERRMNYNNTSQFLRRILLYPFNWEREGKGRLHAIFYKVVNF